MVLHRLGIICGRCPSTPLVVIARCVTRCTVTQKRQTVAGKVLLTMSLYQLSGTDASIDVPTSVRDHKITVPLAAESLRRAPSDVFQTHTPHLCKDFHVLHIVAWDLEQNNLRKLQDGVLWLDILMRNKKRYPQLNPHLSSEPPPQQMSLLPTSIGP